MDYALGFESQYIAAVEFGDKEPTVKLTAITLEAIEDDKGQERLRLVARFEGKKRGWVINKTNAILLAAMFKSRDTDHWIGHSLTLHSQMVQNGRDRVPGIRVKGSPELTEELEVEVKLPKKRPLIVRLVPTGKGAK